MQEQTLQDRLLTRCARMSRREVLKGAAALIPSLYLRRAEQSEHSENWEQQIAEVERQLGGRLGVAAMDSGNGKQIQYRGDERFPMCSTFKVLLVAAILRRVDTGEEKLDRLVPYSSADLLEYAPITKAHLQEKDMTISALCAAAIEYSDNTAANLLLGAIGGPEELTQYARSLGDAVTRLDRNEPALNSAIPGDPRDTTSPSAMRDDLNKVLVEKKALSADSRKLLEQWLTGNTTGTAMIRAGVPSSWRVGDKTGSGKNGAINDIAICWPPDRAPVLITVYSVGSTASYAEHYAAIAKAGRIVATAFS